MRRDALSLDGDSSDVCEDIFELHFPDAEKVLDLTYGKGVFWKFPHSFKVYGNDLNPDVACEFHFDFTRQIVYPGQAEVVVFDPPFMSAGAGHSEGYGSDRTVDGAPQNVGDVTDLLTGGLTEALRLSSNGVIVKTQAVVESGRTFPNTMIAELIIAATPGWRIVDYKWQRSAKRAQPWNIRVRDPSHPSGWEHDENGEVIFKRREVRHFQGKPSLWIVAKRTEGAPDLKLRDLMTKLLKQFPTERVFASDPCPAKAPGEPHAPQIGGTCGLCGAALMQDVTRAGDTERQGVPLG